VFATHRIDAVGALEGQIARLRERDASEAAEDAGLVLVPGGLGKQTNAWDATQLIVVAVVRSAEITSYLGDADREEIMDEPQTVVFWEVAGGGKQLEEKLVRARFQAQIRHRASGRADTNECVHDLDERGQGAP
jgi:hypothetical protein